MISLIAAIAEDNAIGGGNKMLWHISNDLKRFKDLTLKCALIMGRKTYESIGSKPLPQRMNIIITRHAGYYAPNCVVVNSFDDALSAAARERYEDIFVIGGAEIYRIALDHESVERVYLTRVEGIWPDADAFFPEFDPTQWRKVSYSESRRDTPDGPLYHFETYESMKRKGMTV